MTSREIQRLAARYCIDEVEGIAATAPFVLGICNKTTARYSGFDMIPKYSDWQSWDAMKRITYVAQFVTALSFLASTAFAYAAWSEAHQARIEQMKYFVAEKAPELEILRIFTQQTSEPNDPRVAITLKNIGGSSVKGLRIKLRTFESVEVYDSKEGSEYSGVIDNETILKDRTFQWYLSRFSEISDKIGFKFTEPRSYKWLEDESVLATNDIIVGIILIEYKDVLDQNYSRIGYIMAKSAK